MKTRNLVLNSKNLKSLSGRSVETHEGDEASLAGVITGQHEYNRNSQTNNRRETKEDMRNQEANKTLRNLNRN